MNDELLRGAFRFAEAFRLIGERNEQMLAGLRATQARFDALALAPARMAALAKAITVTGPPTLRLLAEQAATLDRVVRAATELPFAEWQQQGALAAHRMSEIASLATRWASAFAVDGEALGKALSVQVTPAARHAEASGAAQGGGDGSAFAFVVDWVLRAIKGLGVKWDDGVVVSLVLTLILHIQSCLSGREDQAALLQAIDRQGERIAGAIASQNAGGGVEAEAPPLSLVVTERLNLRAEPTASAAVLDTMNPDQVILLIERSGEWCYVQYEDHLEGLPRSGWAHSRYLRETAR